MNRNTPSFTLEEIAELTGATLHGDPNHVVQSVDDLESATSCDAAFLDHPKYLQQMLKSKAGVVFIHPSIEKVEGRNFLVTETPSIAFQKVIDALQVEITSGFTSIHPTAIVHAQASIAENVTLSPHVVIDRLAKVGKGTFVGPNVTIGPGVVIGEDCCIHANVVIRERCVIGNRVTLQPGSVIGSCGFGYSTDKQGRHHPLKQVGIVVLEDDVEVGANTTIDRARFKVTKISRGTKIDNLVQIAHQVHLGEDNLIVAQVGIAGSTKTGRNVIMGGQVGVVGHITIADQVILAARAAPSKSIEKSGIYSGAPAIPIREFNEQFVLLRNIKKLVTKVKELEAKVETLKGPSEV